MLGDFLSGINDRDPCIVRIRVINFAFSPTKKGGGGRGGGKEEGNLKNYVKIT